jgi:hypothetical protein
MLCLHGMPNSMLYFFVAGAVDVSVRPSLNVRKKLRFNIGFNRLRNEAWALSPSLLISQTRPVQIEFTNVVVAKVVKTFGGGMMAETLDEFCYSKLKMGKLDSREARIRTAHHSPTMTETTGVTDVGFLELLGASWFFTSIASFKRS